VSVTPTQQGDVRSSRQGHSPPHQQENGKFKSCSLPKLEEEMNTVAVSPVEEKIAGKIRKNYITRFVNYYIVHLGY